MWVQGPTARQVFDAKFHIGDGGWMMVQVKAIECENKLEWGHADVWNRHMERMHY